MKNRVVLIAVLLGVYSVNHSARAGFPASPSSGPNGNKSFQNILGKDVSATEWKTPTTDPVGSFPSDSSTNSILKGFSESHLDSLFGTNNSFQLTGSIHGTNTKVENIKPIEKVTLHDDSSQYDPQPVPVAPRRSETKRITLIALSCAGILAFRKFRRPQSNVPWKKPSFL